MRREAPLDILHLAAHCRNVPVTFTLEGRNVVPHREPKAVEFWEWFVANEPTLFGVDIELERDRDAVFAALSKALGHVSTELTFELGPVREGVRELVLSAGGLKSAFPLVESLAAAAPELPRWHLTKFRPRRNPIMRLSYAGKTVDPAEVECCLLSNGRMVGLYMFFPAYSEEERNAWGQIGYLFLDEALGEYDVEMKLGLIEFFPSDAHPNAPRFPLTELAERFDEHFASIRH